MIRRRAALAFCLPLAAAFPAGAQTFRYAPGTSQYHALVVTRMTREMGTHRSTDELTQVQRFTVGLAPGGGDTLQLTLTLDSASLRSSTAGVQDVRPLVGLRVRGRISPVGVVHSGALDGPDLGPRGALVASELVRFLPLLRGDLRLGTTWTDTVSESIDMLGIPVARRVVTTSRVRGDTTVAQGRGWTIARRSAVTFSGTGRMTGQDVRLEGSSTADATIVVTRAGRFVGSDQSDSTITTFTIPATGMRVGMTQSQQATIRLVP